MDKSLESREARKGGDNELEGSRQAARTKRPPLKPARKVVRRDKR